jgi:hypothetical protein
MFRCSCRTSNKESLRERVTGRPCACAAPFRHDLLMVSGQSTGYLGTGSLSSDPNERCVADHGPCDSWRAICRNLGGFDAGSRVSFAPGYRTLGFRSLSSCVRPRRAVRRWLCVSVARSACATDRVPVVPSAPKCVIRLSELSIMSGGFRAAFRGLLSLLSFWPRCGCRRPWVQSPRFALLRLRTLNHVSCVSRPALRGLLSLHLSAGHRSGNRVRRPVAVLR